jgi:hypothetical protein
MQSIRLLATTALLAAALPAWSSALTPGQLEAAKRVHLGSAQCDAGHEVTLTPVTGKEGHFTLQHRKAKYTLVPEETTTGAVRLEDKKAGIVWIQIPSKSMLMNAKLGQRVADGCKHAEQRSS